MNLFCFFAPEGAADGRAILLHQINKGVTVCGMQKIPDMIQQIIFAYFLFPDCQGADPVIFYIDNNRIHLFIQKKIQIFTEKFEIRFRRRVLRIPLTKAECKLVLYIQKQIISCSRILHFHADMSLFQILIPFLIIQMRGNFRSLQDLLKFLYFIRRAKFPCLSHKAFSFFLYPVQNPRAGFPGIYLRDMITKISLKPCLREPKQQRGRFYVFIVYTAEEESNPIFIGKNVEVTPKIDYTEKCFLYENAGKEPINMQKTKKVSDSMVEQIFQLRPEHLNGAGRLFGGRLMEWIDEVAGLVAIRHSESDVVTAAVDNLKFIRGAYQDDLIVLIGRITYVGRTSMEVRVDTYVESLDGMRRPINRAYFIEVAVDKNNRPKPVPRLEIEGEGQKADWQGAIKRKEMRLQRAKEGF